MKSETNTPEGIAKSVHSSSCCWNDAMEKGLADDIRAYAKEYALACLAKAAEKAKIVRDEVEVDGQMQPAWYIVDKASIHTKENLV